MKEKIYEKRLRFQRDMISRQSEQIEKLKTENENLQLKCKEKDEIISSVSSLRKELAEETMKYKKLKNEFEDLVKELRKMKNVIGQDVFKGRWRLIKFLMK